MTADDKNTGARTEKLREAVAAAPESAKAHYRLGTNLIQMHHNEEAEAELRRAVELDPDFAEAWVNLGGLLFSHFDFAGSVTANEKALVCNPDLVKAHYNKGLSHLYLGEADKLVECFRRVVELEPQDAGGHYHLAVGLHATGHSTEAQQNLDVALELGYRAQPQFIKAVEQGVADSGKVKLPVFDIKPKGSADDPSPR